MCMIVNFIISFVTIYFGCVFVYIVVDTLFGFGLLGIWILADKSENNDYLYDKLDECPNLPYEVIQELWSERDPNVDYELKEGEYY